MSSHLPVNHRLLPLYRTLAALAGLFCFVFGLIGAVRTAGDPVFSRESEEIMGLRTNLAFAIISIVIGAVVLFSAIVGGNSAHFVNLVAGSLFLGSGVLMMALLQTNANFLNFRMATCVISFTIGTVLLIAGLYGRTGSSEVEAHEVHFRQHHGDDPDNHHWKYRGAPDLPVTKLTMRERAISQSDRPEPTAAVD